METEPERAIAVRHGGVALHLTAAFAACSHAPMGKKYAAEYSKQKRAEWARRLRTEEGRPLLDLLAKVRQHTYAAELGDDPRSLALCDLAAAMMGAECLAVVASFPHGLAAMKRSSEMSTDDYMAGLVDVEIRTMQAREHGEDERRRIRASLDITWRMRCRRG